MLKYYLVTTLVAASVAAAVASPMSNELTLDMKVLAPATFQYSELAVVPKEVSTGESVAITLSAQNIGDMEGSYEVELEVNDELVATEDGSLLGGQQEEVAFEVAYNTTGSYNITVAGLKDSFTVGRASGGTRWWAVALGIILGAAALAFFLLRGSEREEVKSTLKEKWGIIYGNFRSLFKRRGTVEGQ